MKAAVFHGPGDIRIDQVPDPRIEEPTDAIVRITHTAICGSDLWFYRGQQDYQPGWRVGHEPMGIVEAIGSANHVLECVGAAGSVEQAIQVARPGGTIGYVGVRPSSHSGNSRGLTFRSRACSLRSWSDTVSAQRVTP